MSAVAHNTKLSNQHGTHLEWLDIAKGLAIFLVVVGHTVSGDVRLAIFSVHMPVFFILAGYTFRPKPWPVLFKKSVQRLLIPYLILVPVVLLPSFFAAQEPLKDRVFALMQILAFPAGYPSTGWTDDKMWAGFFLDRINSSMYGVGMAWFIWCLFLARLLTNATMRLAPPKLRVCDGIFGPSVLALLFLCVGVLASKLFGIFWIFDIDLVFVATGFMFAGIAARNARIIRPKLWPAACIAVVVWYFSMSASRFEMSCRYYESPFLAFGAALAGTYAIAMISLVIQYMAHLPVIKYVEQAIAWAGRHSLEIYCAHAIDYTILGTEELPFTETLRGIVRFCYDLLLVFLFRRLMR